MNHTQLFLLFASCLLFQIDSFVVNHLYSCNAACHEAERSITSKKEAIIRLQANKLSKETSIIVSTRFRRSFLVSLSTMLTYFTNISAPAHAIPEGFKRIPTQFIAALGDPKSKSGTNAKEWGIWKLDPGPRGVFLEDYTEKIVNRDGVAPSGWKFNKLDWWLEEHGLIMEAPEFPLEAGKYLVTGGRMVTSPLTVTYDGSWILEKGVLYDVTHLPCRSAKYTGGSPTMANQKNFPVKPGAEMPRVEGCEKLDYAVLFVIGKQVV